MRFVAQSLDNDAPMLVAIGRDLTAEGDPRRRAVLDDSSAILGRGNEHRITEHVVLYELGDGFAIEVCPERRDDEGRLAPLVAVVSAASVKGNSWEEDCLAEVRWFADTATRRLDDDRERAVMAALAEIKKKVSRLRHARKLVVAACLAAALVVLAAVLAWAQG